jgi:hypothetical protein
VCELEDKLAEEYRQVWLMCATIAERPQRAANVRVS